MITLWITRFKMSQSLKSYIDSFISKDITAGCFVDTYMIK
ncbi:hypothetical protein Y788_07400 [Pantoea dispersa 625]|nr:hypothetical protein Y788_07400 [Pantoea dispersa 625]